MSAYIVALATGLQEIVVNVKSTMSEREKGITSSVNTKREPGGLELPSLVRRVYVELMRMTAIRQC